MPKTKSKTKTRASGPRATATPEPLPFPPGPNVLILKDGMLKGTREALENYLLRRRKAIPLTPSTQITDPHDLFIPRPGKEGAPMAGRVRYEVKQQVAEIIQGGKTEFRTESDYVNAAVCWFHHEIIVPLIRDKRLSADASRTEAEIRRAKRLARMNDVDRYLSVNKDALLKLAKASEPEVVCEHWADMMGTAKENGPTFAKAVRKFMESDPVLKTVREIVAAGKAKEH